MSLDGKVLARARQRLHDRKDSLEAEYEARRRKVYAKAPHIAQIDKELHSLLSDALSQAFSHGVDLKDAVAEASNKADLLRSERAACLCAAGFPENWLDETPICEKCGDSGYNGTEPCSCLMELYKEELHKSLSSVLKLGNETFDTFSLNWYDDAYDPALGKSVRAHMETVYENCREYARKFKSVKYNLFLNGGTGLGKTFLSACIARVVSEAGHSVVYETANSLFSTLEDHKFDRGEEQEVRNDVHRYLNCDLLIIDDLGTELTTSFTVSALYNLINSRLISGKKTVISSNLSLDDMRLRYSPQIMSRLEGEYIVLHFYGDDIRLKKRGR